MRAKTAQSEAALVDFLAALQLYWEEGAEEPTADDGQDAMLVLNHAIRAARQLQARRAAA